jgi:solute carrier family 8 (sodium/calcium exchanger)
LADKEASTAAEHLSQAMKINWDQVAVGNANYKAQFISAFYCNGSAEDQKEAKCLDWFLHIMSFPWKMLFALVPPTEYAGGWVCFGCALGMIGFVTVIIGDLAELLGCVIGLSSFITANTLVALGTSLPDTFASKTAARSEPYADNSIGNVTGSNSVNVFLGLGLPWMMAAIFWATQTCEAGDSWSLTYPDIAQTYPTGIFVVYGGSLGTFVTTFCICALMCIGTLVLRRKVVGGELGGNPVMAYGSAGFFVALWFVYIIVVVINS